MADALVNSADGVVRCPPRKVPATRAFFVNLMTLSSRRLALSPARRGISRGVAMFIRYRQSRTFLLEPRNARSQTLLGLHHGQQSTLARPLRGHRRQPAPPRVGTQKETQFWIHERLQPQSARLLRSIFVAGPRD